MIPIPYKSPSKAPIHISSIALEPKLPSLKDEDLVALGTRPREWKLVVLVSGLRKVLCEGGVYNHDIVARKSSAGIGYEVLRELLFCCMLVVVDIEDITEDF